MFELTDDEIEDLRSSFLTANINNKSRYNPCVFAKQGLYMLLTVLKGDLAIKQSKALSNSIGPNLKMTVVYGYFSCIINRHLYAKYTHSGFIIPWLMLSNDRNCGGETEREEIILKCHN